MSETVQTVLAGDCIQGMRKLESGTAKLVFADPPYNIGIDYGQGVKADKLSDRDFTKLLFGFIKEAHRVLTPDGSLWVLLSEDHVAECAMIMRDAGFHRRNWICLHENFGVQTTKKFARCHRHLLYFAKDKKRFIFNDEAVRVPSARLTVYGDKRANPKGKIDQDVWSMTRLCGSFKDRLPGYPTQLPIDLPLRIVNVASNPGDTIVDPFSGSGVTGQACLVASGGMRNFLGFELNEGWAKEAQERISLKKKELLCSAAS